MAEFALQRTNNDLEEAYNILEEAYNIHALFRLKKDEGDTSARGQPQPPPPPPASMQPPPPIEHIRSDELKLDDRELLARGSFKQVYKVRWSSCRKKSDVVLLELQNTRDAAISAFQEEARIFTMLGQHRHLAQLLATTTHPDSGNQCMIMEFAPEGSLDKVLNRFVEDEVDISASVLINVAIQVADAMVHLDLYKVIHRDLAARNVLVFGFDAADWSKVHVKVTDYGLALLVQGTSTGTSLIEVTTNPASMAGPVRWMAVESIKRRIYSRQSDVWAFGVLLWEIMTKGEVPYGNYGQDHEAAKAIIQGERLEKPDDCPDDVYAIMQSCWQERPRDRPVMTDIQSALMEALGPLTENVDDTAEYIRQLKKRCQFYQTQYENTEKQLANVLDVPSSADLISSDKRRSAELTEEAEQKRLNEEEEQKCKEEED